MEYWDTPRRGRRNEPVATDTLYHTPSVAHAINWERAARNEIRRLRSVMDLERVRNHNGENVGESDSDSDTLPSLEWEDASNGDDSDDTNRDEDDDYVRIEYDDLFPTGDDERYFDKKGQIIDGKVLTADRCAHRIDMMAVHNDLEGIVEQAMGSNLGTRMLQQIRDMAIDTDTPLRVRYVVKNDGRCKARLVIGMVGE